MRNKVMETQINNLLLSVSAFRQSLDFFAVKDDGVITRDEKKSIRKLTEASRKFEKILEKVKSGE